MVVTNDDIPQSLVYEASPIEEVERMSLNQDYLEEVDEDVKLIRRRRRRRRGRWWWWCERGYRGRRTNIFWAAYLYMHLCLCYYVYLWKLSN